MRSSADTQSACWLETNSTIERTQNVTCAAATALRLKHSNSERRHVKAGFGATDDGTVRARQIRKPLLTETRSLPKTPELSTNATRDGGRRQARAAHSRASPPLRLSERRLIGGFRELLAGQTSETDTTPPVASLIA